MLKVSADARKAIMASEFKPPHPKVAGYTGPESVDMEAGKCTQNAADLEAMRNGFACKEIADITLQHEEAHRTLCTSMGADKYWGAAAQRDRRGRGRSATRRRPTPCAAS